MSELATRVLASSAFGLSQDASESPPPPQPATATSASAVAAPASVTATRLPLGLTFIVPPLGRMGLVACITRLQRSVFLRRDSSPDRLEQLLGVALAHGREPEGQQAQERRAGEEVGDVLDVDVRAQFGALARLEQEVDDRSPAWVHDAFDIDTRERRVALKLAEDAGEDPTEERIGEEADEVVDVLEQARIGVAFLEHVEVGSELVERVGDQLLLRGPASVDRVPADTSAVRDRLDRRRLEAPLREQRDGRLENRFARGGPSRAATRPRPPLDCAVLRRGLRFVLTRQTHPGGSLQKASARLEASTAC